MKKSDSGLRHRSRVDGEIVRSDVIKKIMEQNPTLGCILQCHMKNETDYSTGYVRGMTMALWEFGLIDSEERDAIAYDDEGGEDE